MSESNDVKVNFTGDTSGIEGAIAKLGATMKKFTGQVDTLGNNLADSFAAIETAITGSGKASEASLKKTASVATDAAKKVSFVDLVAAADKKAFAETSINTDNRIAASAKASSEAIIARANAEVISTRDTIAAQKAKLEVFRQGLKFSAVPAEHALGAISTNAKGQARNAAGKFMSKDALGVAEQDVQILYEFSQAQKQANEELGMYSAHAKEAAANSKILNNFYKARIKSVDELLEAEKRANLFRTEQAKTTVKFDALQTPMLSTRVETSGNVRQRQRASQQVSGGPVTSSKSIAGVVTDKSISLIRADTLAKQRLINTDYDLAKSLMAVELATRAETKAVEDNIKKLKEKADAEANSSAARYALYDIARVYTVVSAAIVAATVYVVKNSADMESAFTSVERTLGANTTVESVNRIRTSLIDLSTQIPKTFTEITQIATLGNQLGVVQKDLEGFVKTVSEFSVTTGIDVEGTAQAFGLLGNLLDVPVKQYKNLASSIALVGLNSVATEAQIIAVSQQIAAGAKDAGFAADEVIGLSAATASLKISPEQSRSSLTTYFNGLNKAAANGGVELENFAKVTGMTTRELDIMIRSGNQGKAIFTAFLEGLNKTSSVGVTAALEELNLNGLRVDNTFRRFADNPGLLKSTFENASLGMASGTEASRQYAKVADDLNSIVLMLQSAFNALVNELGSQLVPGISLAAKEFKSFIQDTQEFAKSDTAKTIFTIITALSSYIAILLAFKATMLIAGATTLAFGKAQAFLVGANGIGAVGKLITTSIPQLFSFAAANVAAATGITTVTGATLRQTVAAVFAAGALNGQSKATVVLSLASRGLAAAVMSIPGWGWALAGVGALVALTSVMNDLRSSSTLAGLGLTSVAERAAAGGRDLRQLGTDAGATLRALREVNALQERGPVVNATAQVSSAKVNALDPQHEIVNVAADTEAVKTQMAALDAELAAMINSGNIDEVTAQLEKQGYTAAIAARQLPAYTVALSAARIEAAGIANEKFAKDFADATSAVSDAEAALKKLKKTATGTAKPVRTLSDYANDLANVFKRSFDIRFSSQAALDNITSAFADLRKESEAARISLMQLSADKAVKEYFLSIANAYGDTLRAGQLAAEIAKINQDIADAQSNASTELKGNSAAAIKNRATMRGMVTSYDAYIQSLADSGASQKELQAAIRQGKQDFTDQAIALGFSSTELGIYSSHFDDLATAVQKVPKNVTVTANLNPALQAMNEFVAKSKASGAAAGSAYGAAYAEATLIAAKKAANDTLRTQIAAMRAVLAITTNDSRTTSLMNNINSLVSQMYKDPSGKAYATGGYTGAGGKYDVAGIVHKGEYVVPKSQVNQSTGLPYGQTNNPSYFSGGLVGGGSGMMMVSLSPEDRGLLRQIGGSGEVVLYANNEAIARSSSAGSKSIVASGGRL